MSFTAVTTIGKLEMPSMTRDQIRHEVINLQKTLNLLERLFKEEDWTRWSSKDRNDKWLKAQSILTVSLRPESPSSIFSKYGDCDI